MTDLFVYGTLQPGGERWPAIAELVEVLGPATASGLLVATPMGWPAAIFGDGGTVHGTLLRPRPGRGDELLRTTDAIEGEGRLFHRVTVSVDGPHGPQPAAAYAWHDTRGAPPGQPLPGGRWPP